MKKTKLLNPKSGYDLYAPFYDKKLAYLDSFEQFHLLPNLEDIKGKTILDAGAGTGRLTLRLAEKGADVTAIDISPEILKILKKKNNKIKTMAADAESLPFPDNSLILLSPPFNCSSQRPKIFLLRAIASSNPAASWPSPISTKTPTSWKPKGKIIIESYYHRPEQVLKDLKNNLLP